MKPPFNLRYIGARLLNMAVRPAALSATAFCYGKQPAEQLSLIIFAVAIGMMLMSIDPYRAYYKKLFNGLAAGRDFVVYLITLCTWGAIVSAAVAATLLIKGVPATIAFLSVGMFVGEKAADEILRFRLFERDVTRWSHYVIGRSSVQLLGLVICLALPDRSLAFHVYAIIFCFSWALAFFQPIRSVLSIAKTHITLFTGARMRRSAALRFTASASLMLSSLMSSAPTYFDKVITLLVDKSSLPLFLIASMSFSIIGNFVDFFFVSRIRIELLRNHTPVAKIMVDPKLWACVTAGVVAGSCIIGAERFLLGHIYDFTFSILALIAALNITLALTAIPQQVVYWRDGPRGIFAVELPFLLLLGIPFCVRLGHIWTLTGALCVIAIALAVRLGLYLVRGRGSRPGGEISMALPDLDGRPTIPRSAATLA